MIDALQEIGSKGSKTAPARRRNVEQEGEDPEGWYDDVIHMLANWTRYCR